MHDHARIDDDHGGERPDHGPGGHYGEGHGADRQERHRDDHHDDHDHRDDRRPRDPEDDTDGDQRPDDLRDRNQVVLAGRLPEAPVEKLLPSGDRMTTWRVIVRRPADDRTDGRSKARVDSVPCVTFDPALRGLVEAWHREDFVEVGGMIRRRFWRTPEGGAGSRIEVDVRRARRLERAPSCGDDEPPHRGHTGSGQGGGTREAGKGAGASTPGGRGRAAAPVAAERRARVLA